MAERDKLDIPEGRFPSNSGYSSIRTPGKVRKVSASAEEPAPDKFVEGDIKPEKKSLMKRIADAFIAVDAKDIKTYLIFDVLIPGLKRGAEDILHMALYNDNNKSGRVTRSRGESRLRRLEYSSIRPARDDDDVMLSSRFNAGQTDLVFPTRDKAEEALDMVAERIQDAGFATLKYYYTITRQPTEWSQASWGWRSMAGATIVQCRGGYLLKMPKLEEI